MKEIPLTQNKIALVDDADFEFLNVWKWYAHKERGNYYAVRKSPRVEGKQTMIYMHSMLINIPKGYKCDHMDRNSLNNQRGNLRLASNAQNLQNRPAQRNNTSGYKGVVKAGKRFTAQIQHMGKWYPLGTFGTAEMAAIEYDKKALELFGEFAVLNFPSLAQIQ